MFRDDPGVIIQWEPGAHWFDALVAVAALLCPVFTSIPAFALVLRDALLLLGSASILELDVDGTRVPFPLSSVHSGFFLPDPEIAEQLAELLTKILVEVEVDEGVVDVGDLGKDGGEHEDPGGHVLVLFVEKQEEGHTGIREPGEHEAQADAEKHLEEDAKGGHM